MAFTVTAISSIRTTTRCLGLVRPQIRSISYHKSSFNHSNTNLLRRPFNIRRPLLPPISRKPVSQVWQRNKFNDYGPNEDISKGSKIACGTIIAICVGVYAFGSQSLSNASQNKWFNENMVLSLENIRQGRYHTILTSAFTHATITHLSFNMFALWNFGPSVAMVFSLPSFLTLYLGSAVACSLAELLIWKSNVASAKSFGAVGSSGAIFGLLGAFAYVAPSLPVQLLFIPVSFALGRVAIGTTVLSVVAIYQDWLPGIAHAGHLGGLAFGVVFAIAQLRGRRRIRGRWF